MTRDELYQNEDVQLAVAQAAGRVARRYRRFISHEDLVQSAWLWVSQHPQRVSEELPNPEDSPRGQRQTYGRLVRLLERALERVARAEKAAAEGYDPDDEAFYENGLIEQLLPTVWQPDAALNPPQQDGERVRSNADPAEGNNWPVLVSDMKRAWELADLTPDDRTMLSLRYGSGLTLDQVALAMETTKETALKRLRMGIHSLARALHGVRPLYLPAEVD